MSEDEQLEQLINQTLDGAMASIPAHLLEIEQNNRGAGFGVAGFVAHFQVLNSADTAGSCSPGGR